jgi:SAM-dependent methyltransferase
MAGCKAGMECLQCGVKYPRNRHGRLNLTLRKPKRVLVPFDLAPEDGAEGRNPFRRIGVDRACTRDFRGIRKLQVELLPVLRRETGPSKRILDIGCEEAQYRRVAESMGYEYMGMDIEPCAAQSFQGDAHALPLVDGFFDVVMANNVFEHLRYPFVAMREIRRVLKPGGLFAGTWSFLEPFHLRSRLHATHLGVLDLLHFGGLEPEWIAPSPGWDVFKAFAGMGFIPRLPGALVRACAAPLRMLYALSWGAGTRFFPRNKELTFRREGTKAGSFSFVARKPE